MRLFFIKVNPLQLFVGSFALAITVGTFLLKTPFAVNGSPLSWVDAAFTSTSAMCVTGLIVVDTGSKFTLFGQAVIIGLIQLGGLGIMTFSTFILLVVGKKLGISGSFVIRESFSESGSLKIGKLILLVLIFTMLMEICGTVFLFFEFRNYYPASEALWSAVFHSISAFCNAGFSLNSDSFMGFSGSYIVNFTITTLIILGGIGFPVVQETLKQIRAKIRKKPRTMNIHTKIVIIITLALLAGGTLLFYISEPQCNSSDHGFLKAYFQSVTTRTAGFNTIDFSKATTASVLVGDVLMFIGGSSGSTAGGIKTTTFMVLLILTWTHLSGKSRPEFGKRTIPSKTTVKVLSLLVLFIIIVIFATFGILISHQNLQIPNKFSGVLFEVISAVGTVGLSTGVTGYLHAGGKMIIIVVMFLGRLGPIAIAKLFIQERKKGNYRFPEENLMIG